MMRSKKDRVLTETELLEMTKWHIARYDGLRQALSSRAAVVLSGDALITGGIAVLLSRVTDAPSLGGLSISVRIAAQTGMLLSVAASFMSVSTRCVRSTIDTPGVRVRLTGNPPIAQPSITATR